MIEKAIALLSPVSCYVCNASGSFICDDCFKQHIQFKQPSCFLCNRLSLDGRTCITCRRKTKLVAATITFRLDSLVEQLIYDLKYHDKRQLAKFFGRTLASHIKPNQFDMITFVPSDGKRQRQRGYNQAHLLAREAARASGLVLQASLLRLVHRSQVGLSRNQRFVSVQDNFITTANVRGKQILIVDDVLTTGATLSECARVLKQAGAKRVCGLVVAKK